MRQRSLKIGTPGGLVLLIVLLLFLQSAGLASIRFPGHAAPTAANTGPRVQDQKNIFKIEPGVPVERTLSGGEAHTYEINLKATQFLQIVVDQRGIDVAVTLYGPDGKQLLEVDSPNSDRGPEPIWFVSDAAGPHRVVVRSGDKDAETGKYEMRMAELRTATTQDRNRADGQAEMNRGTELLLQETDDSSKRAAEKFQSALALWRASGDRQGEADALFTIGWFYGSIHDGEKALECYDRALLLVRKLGDKGREATLLFHTGNEHINSTVEQKQKSLIFYNQALDLMRQVGDRWGEARCLNKIGQIYSFTSETQKAFEYYLPLLALLQSLGADRQYEAEVLNYIGGLHANLGDYQKALDYFNQALPISHEGRDRELEYFTLRNIGTAYSGLGEYERALSWFAQANPVTENLPDRRAQVLDDTGAVYAKLGEYRKALDYYDRALSIWRERKSRRNASTTLRNIGSAYRDLGDYQRAIDFYNQALPHKRYVGERRGEAAILSDLGTVYLLMGDDKKGLDYYQQAFELSRAVADQAVEGQALNGMARAHRNLGDLEAARSRSEAALDIVESLRAKIATRELRISYYASVQQYYETYIDVLMRLHQLHPASGYDALALEASERARARSLVEMLNEARVEIREGVDPALLARARSLQQQINAKTELQMRLLNGKSSEEELAGLKKETGELLLKYEEAEAQIRINSPRYAALMQPVPLKLKEIQRLLAADTLLLEYRLGDERSYLWAVTSTSVASFVLPGRKQIELAARQTYDLLTARNLKPKFETTDERRRRIAKADAEYPRAAALLGEMVLAPAGKLLGAKRLVVVTDGALQYVPFAALSLSGHEGAASESGGRSSAQAVQDPPFSPLVDEHEIVDLPSVSTLAILRRELSERREPAKKLTIIADPVFDKDDDRVKGRTPRTDTGARGSRVNETRREAGRDQTDETGEVLRSARESGFGEDALRIPRLPFTRREATEIASLVPAADRQVFLDFAANRAAAMSPELAQYRYVHFATHGLLNTVHPELSGLVFSLIDRNGQQQDGFLRAFEVYNLRLNADMVVLSGCRTGLGKEIKGEGLLGLTRGFLYAGSQRVLVSLWATPDEASAELMVQAYRGMLGSARLRPAAALRAAQRRMIKEPKWQAPYYWAAFVLRGEPN